MSDSSSVRPSSLPDQYLGPCCVCETIIGVRNIVMLDKLSPTPGRGWGCFVCGLPQNGAVVVLCDTCLEAGTKPRFACVGYPGQDGRVPIGELQGDFHHDLKLHRMLLRQEAPRISRAEKQRRRRRLYG